MTGGKYLFFELSTASGSVTLASFTCMGFMAERMRRTSGVTLGAGYALRVKVCAIVADESSMKSNIIDCLVFILTVCSLLFILLMC